MKRIRLITVFILSSLMLVSSMSIRGYAQDEILTVNTSSEVSVNAKAYALMDVNTGTLLLGNNEHDMLYPASVTKIMTLLLVCEALDSGKLTPDMEITCSESAAEKGGSQIWLEPGEVMIVRDLLKATVVYSANDACCLLGETISGDETAFCQLMNKRAAELGMKNTNFDNCTGLDDDTDTHKTTAYDIALMSRELLKYEIIREYTNIWMDSLRNGKTQLVNTNKLIRTYPGATGLKTGTTSKAGCCVSASAERDGLELVAVVLGADNSKDRFSGAKALLDWGFANYEIVSPDINEKYPHKIIVTHGVKEEISLTADECPQLLVNKGIKNDITYETVIPEKIEAPVQKGHKAGELIVRYKDKILASCDILADEDVNELTLLNSLKMLIYSLQKK